MVADQRQVGEHWDAVFSFCFFNISIYYIYNFCALVVLLLSVNAVFLVFMAFIYP